MPTSSDQITNSSPIPFNNHTALLLSVALPFLQPAYRHPVELALKFLEFSETLKLFREFTFRGENPFHPTDSAGKTSSEDGLFGLIHTFILDPEGLLNSLSCVCTGDEREIIGMFLNIIRVKNFYDTYGDLLQMPGLFSGGTPFSGSSDFTETKTGKDNFSASSPEEGAPFPMSHLTSMLNNEQQETLQLLKSLFSEE